MNYFSLMLRKRLRNDEDGADDEELVESGKSKKPGKEKELKISEMDDWMDSDDDEPGSDEEENKKKISDDEDDTKMKKKSKGNHKQNEGHCFQICYRN